MDIPKMVIVLVGYAIGANLGFFIVNKLFERHRARRDARMKNITPRREK